MSVFQEIDRKKANLFWHIIDIISSIYPFFGDIYQRHIGAHYREEAKNLDFSNIKSILHIGSGAFPITAIVLADLFNGRIVTIDKNPIAVKIAQNVIKKKNLAKRVEVLCGDGLSFDVSHFDVVIISSCSVPKEEILTHVFTKTKDTCTIIVRELSSEIEWLNTFVKQFNMILPSGELSCCAAPNLCWNSLFFQKKQLKKK